MRLLTLPFLLLLAAPGLAQEPVEYLLDGRDKKRGGFLGQLLLTPQGQGAWRAAQRATFREHGVEAIEGTGRRQGAELRVELPATAGLSGALTGAQPGPPLRLRARFHYQDSTCRTQVQKGTEQVSQAYGHRVDAPQGTGFPDAALRPAPDSASHTYAAFKGVPFIKGEGDPHAVAINDVGQGSLGDCYFMAGLAAVARSQPERIQAMVQDHGDGSFSVYMWAHNDQWGEEVEDPDGTYEYVLSARRVRVDDHFPAGWNGATPAYAKFGDQETTPDGERRVELWPMLFEKAYAQLKGSYSIVGEGGFASTPMSFFSSEQVEDHDPQEMTPDSVRAVMKAAERDGRPMTLGVPSATANSAMNLYGNHYYAFWGFDADGNVLVYNPWGSSHPPRGLTFEEVCKHFDSLHVGPK